MVARRTFPVMRLLLDTGREADTLLRRRLGEFYARCQTSILHPTVCGPVDRTEMVGRQHEAKVSCVEVVYLTGSLRSNFPGRDSQRVPFTEETLMPKLCFVARLALRARDCALPFAPGRHRHLPIWVVISSLFSCSDDGAFVADLRRVDTPRFSSEWKLSTGGIAVDDVGSVHATSFDDRVVHVFSAEGQEIDQWAVVVNGDSLRPLEMAYRNGRFYVTTPSQIVVLDNTFAVIRHWDNVFTRYGSFGVDAIDADRTGDVYVLHDLQDIVVRFSSTGVLEVQWPLEGRGPLLDEFPGIAVTDDGLVYISNRALNRVEKYSSDGEFLGFFGDIDTDPRRLQTPWGLDISDGVLFVTDLGNYRIQMRSLRGVYLSEFFAAASDGESGDNPALVSVGGGSVGVAFRYAVAVYQYKQ